MNKENNKLGMGLGALLNSNNNKNKNSTNKIDISKIFPNKEQPRKNFEEKLNNSTGVTYVYISLAPVGTFGF